MKTTFLIIAAVISILVTSCNENNFEQVPSNVNFKSINLDSICRDSVFTSGIDDLSTDDIEGLLLMIEEEKLAHDVYVYFYERYELSIFDRISMSETKHTELVLRLLNYFGLEDPTINETGIFSNDELQGLYNTIIETGNESVEAALTSGALIEETDIADLQRLLDATENIDIITVYSKLLRGSYNHLKAFNRTLLSYDITYVPSILTQQEFDAILLTQNGNMQGKGKGNGQGGGNGHRNSQNSNAVCDSSGIGNGTPILDGQGSSTRGNGQKGSGNNGNGKKGGRN